MRRRLKAFFAIATSGALIATAAVPAAAAPPAGSPAYKDCGEITFTGRDHHFTEEFQTANCGSQGTGQEDTGPVTNNGGNQPPGQQP